MIDLKPCPFCGCKAEWEVSFYTQGMFKNQYKLIRCSGCNAEMDNHWVREESLATDWNTRADMAKPKIKPLVWKWYRDPRETSEARTSIGSWRIWEVNGSAYCCGPDDTYERPCGRDIEDAKSAAQAEYERLIMSALEGI